MTASTLLTLLAIIVALLTAGVYLLQIVELLEKRLPRVIGWIKKRRQKKDGIRPAESLPSFFSEDQHRESQENYPQRI